MVQRASPRASGRLGALHSSPALDVKLPTALQVLQGQGRCVLGCVPSLLFAHSFLFSLRRGPAGASHGRNTKNLATLKGGDLSLLLDTVLLLLRFPRTESNDAYSVTIFKKNTLALRRPYARAREVDTRRGREPKPSDPEQAEVCLAALRKRSLLT